jgi:membrane protein required for colicin V production
MDNYFAFLLRQFNSFDLYDLLFIGLVTLLSIRGLLRGVLKESFGLTGLVVGVYFASCLSVDAGMLIENYLYSFRNPKLLQLLGFIGIFFVFWLSNILLGKIFYALSQDEFPKLMSRILGWLLSWVKYFVLLSFLIVALSPIRVGEKSIIQHTGKSQIYPICQQITSVLLCFKKKD